jgi:hypothetical protein
MKLDRERQSSIPIVPGLDWSVGKLTAILLAKGNEFQISIDRVEVKYGTKMKPPVIQRGGMGSNTSPAASAAPGRDL